MKRSTALAIVIGAGVLAGLAALAYARPQLPARPITTRVGKRYRFSASIRPRLASADGLALKTALEASGAQNVVVDFTAAAGTFAQFDQVEAFSVTLTPGVSSMTLQGHKLTIDKVEPLADNGEPLL